MTFSRAATVFLAGALTACGTPPTERFYTLSMPEVEASPKSAAFAVAVEPVVVPEVVDRPQMVVRVASNRVEVSELNRWAEPLKRALPRAIAANIAQELPDARVYLLGTDNPVAGDYRVRVSIDRFESELGKNAVVDATWAVRFGAEVTHGRTTARVPSNGPGYDAMVAAHSIAAATIGRDIAAAVSALKR